MRQLSVATQEALQRVLGKALEARQKRDGRLFIARPGGAEAVLRHHQATEAAWGRTDRPSFQSFPKKRARPG